MSMAVVRTLISWVRGPFVAALAVGLEDFRDPSVTIHRCPDTAEEAMADKLLLTAQHVLSILGSRGSKLDLLIRMVYRVVTSGSELLCGQNLRWLCKRQVLNHLELSKYISF